jgi:AcrR family transcriptional regulator
MVAKKSSRPKPKAVLQLVDSAADVPNTWQERAVERRLSTAKAQAIARSSRFLATALELVEESGSAEFTIQTLIDRSSLSLRAFYQHFEGKDELLLALYESITSEFTEAIRQDVAAADGPMEQLEAFCRAFLARSESSGAIGGKVMTLFSLTLEIDQPRDFYKVWEPHHKLLTKILSSCARAGLVRTDLTPAQLTTLMATTLTALAQLGVFRLGGKDNKLTEDHLWAWCKQAVRAPAPDARSKPIRKSTTRATATRRTNKLAQ